jgi:hypothetical protein
MKMNQTRSIVVQARKLHAASAEKLLGTNYDGARDEWVPYLT